MSIYGINLDLFSSSPIVILKVEDETRYLAVNLVAELGGSMEKVTVTELRDSTFFAVISVEIDGRTVEIDSRPSDAIALAVRAGAEIFAADDVIEEAAVVFEEAMEETPEDEVVDKFKDWMNQVSPEDFK